MTRVAPILTLPTLGEAARLPTRRREAMGMVNWVMAGDGLVTRLLPLVLAESPDFDCERFRDGFWGQPVNSVTSLAFVAAGIAILAGDGTDRTIRRVYGSLVAATGAGSVVQHGPNPPWADLAHDLPLIALIAFVAVDAASDVTGRRLPAVWWIAPTLALSPMVATVPAAADAAQVAMAVVAIGLSLQRVRMRPAWRSTIMTPLVMLAAGGLIGTLSRSGWPLCRPDSLLQGHAVWHVLAAAALWRLTPVVGRIGTRSPARSG